jgi:uncharacterized protein YjaG (DUF416 family)
MVTHVFDEQALRGQLERLPPRLRAVFAAAAAERLLPAYVRHGTEQDRATLAALLDNLWTDLETASMSDEQIQHAIDTCLRLIPDEDSEEWSEGSAAAEDAAAALCYAFRTRQSGDPQEAAWAARRLYEALDNFVINREQIDDNSPGMEARVLGDPLVQSELERQRRDLEELLAGTKAEKAVIHRVRQRARREAKSVFGPGDRHE